jgi:hypothetical protein
MQPQVQQLETRHELNFLFALPDFGAQEKDTKDDEIIKTLKFNDHQSREIASRI